MQLLPSQLAEPVTRGDIHPFGDALRTELRGDMAELRAVMIERFATAKIETHRMITAGMIANAIAVIAALLA